MSSISSSSMESSISRGSSSSRVVVEVIGVVVLIEGEV